MPGQETKAIVFLQCSSKSLGKNADMKGFFGKKNPVRVALKS